MSPTQIASLLSSGEYSDFTIECQGQSFKVHRAIVCSQSPVIDAALRGEFEVVQYVTQFQLQNHKSGHLLTKETQEARTNIVKIDGFDVETVQRMLHFMYGVENSPSKEPAQESPNERPEEPSKEASEGAPTELSHRPIGEPPQQPIEGQKKKLISQVWTNAIADYYNVPKLYNLVTKEIAHFFQTEWSPVIFLEVAKVVSSSTGDTELHHLFAQLAVEHVEELLDYDDDFTGLVALDDFAVQFMKGSADRMAELRILVNTHSDLVDTHVELLAEAKKVKDNMGRCMQMLYDTTSCRHCQADFDCYHETHDHKTYTLRCAKCRTRHNP